MDNKQLVKSIRQLCKNNDIAISQLENNLNFGAGLISRWNKNSPSIDKIIDIADYFHVSLDEVVGYKINTNDVFLNKLHEQTESDSIIWEDCETMSQNGSKVKQYSDFEMPGQYIGEYENETSYATCFNSGYIIMYAYHKEDQIINPYNLILFIQPNDDAYLVDQHYTKEELHSLWIKILNHLGDNAPDEIKAEDLKNSFIKDKSKKSIDSYSEEQLKLIVKNMVDIEPQLPKLFEIINMPEFIKFFNMMQYPDLQQNLELAQRLSKYYEMIVDESKKTP